MFAIVDKIKANQPEKYFTPATDSEAKIIISDEEAKASEIFELRWVNAAFQTLRKPDMWIGSFKELPTMEQERAAQWKITFTSQRFIVWSPLTVNILQQMKSKSGSASGGHVLYKWIDVIERQRYGNGIVFALEFSAHPKNDTDMRSRIIELWLPNNDEASKIATVLSDRIAAYWQNQAVDAPELRSELDKLKAIDWNPSEEAVVNLTKAGAPTKYLPERLKQIL